jgi:type IV secretion system protein VirD4
MKTGARPMRTRLRLFLDWGITFGEPYIMPERATRRVVYAGKDELEAEIIRRHYTSAFTDFDFDDTGDELRSVLRI